MKKNKDKKHDRGRKRFSAKQALEPRILFDATVGAATHVVDQLMSPSDTSDTSTHADTASLADAHPKTPEVSAPVGPVDLKVFDSFQKGPIKDSDLKKSTSDLSNDATKNALNSDAQPNATIDAMDAAAKPTELLFVDSGIHGFEKIVNNARSNVEVIVLDPQRDGFAQITNSLANHQNVTGISLITHGDVGKVAVGSDLLSLKSLDDHATEIANWQTSLAKEANFKIYGGDVGPSEAGKELLLHFSNLINTKVASANNLTESGLLKDGVDLKVGNDTVYVSLETIDNVVYPNFGSEQDTTDSSVATDQLDQQVDYQVDAESTDLSLIPSTDDQYASSYGVTVNTIFHESNIDVAATEGSSVSTIIFKATDVGDDRTYSLSGPDSSAFNIDSGGNLRFVEIPDYETKSSYDITIHTYLNDTLHSTATVNIDVIDLPPVLVSPTYSYILDGTDASTIVYEVKAFDPAGGVVTYALTGQDASAFTINAVTGAIALKDAANMEAKSNYSLVVKALDANGLYSAQSLNLIVTTTFTENPENLIISNSNDIILYDPLVTVDEGIGTGTVIYTAFDQGGTNRTYSLVDDPNYPGDDAAKFTIDNGGKIKFVASPDYETQTAYYFSINTYYNGVLNSNETMIVEITDKPPVFSSGGHNNWLENTSTSTVIYTAVAADPLGGTVTYSLTGADAAFLNIDSATGQVRFNSPPDFETKSSYSYSVKASDPSGMFTTKALTFNITNVNNTITSPGTASVAEGSATNTVVYTIVAADPVGANTYSLAGTDAASFNVDSVTGVVTFKNIPDRDTKASYSIQVRATDTIGTITRNVTINVTNVAPVVTSGGTATVNEGAGTGTVVYTTVAADPGGGVLTYTLSGTDAALFSINASGVVSVKAGTIINFETKSSYAFNVNVKDANNTTTIQAVALTVIDSTPVFSSGTTANVNEGVAAGTLVYTAAANDPIETSEVITYSLTGADASAFTINSSNGQVTINAIPDFETKSTYNFNVVASDSLGTPATQAVVLTINNVAPTISSGASASVAEGISTGTAVYTATASDPAGGTITYSLVAGGDAAAFNIDSATGAVKFNASPDFETKSTYNITVKAADASGAFTTKAVTIDVTNVAPSITSGALASVLEGTAITTPVYTAIASDPSGGAITYSLVAGGDAAAFNIDSATGEVKFNAIPDFETKSNYSITVKASDASGAFATKAVTIDVTNVAPNITSGASASVLEGTSTATTVYTAVASDPAGGIVTYSIVAGGDSTAFNIDSTTGAVKFNAIPDFETKSSYSITVKASDASGAFTTKAVTIDVTNVAPNITSGASASVLEGTSTATTVYTAVASDPAGGTVTYSLVAGGDAAAFNIDSATGAVKFNAIPDFETKSSYSITVKASDASGAFATKAVTIDVTNVAPNITSGASASVLEGTSTATTVYTAVASDPAGGTVTYSLVAGGDAAAFNIDSATGAVKFNAIPDFETKSSYSITVKAADASGAFTTKVVTIDVTNVAPNITSGASASVLEGTATTTPVYTAVASDPGGGTVIYSLVAGGDAAAFNINTSTGEIKFNDIPDFETKSSYSITVKAADASGLFTTKAVTIDVTNVAPNITSGASASVLEGTSTATTVYTAVASDPAGGTVTYSFSGGVDDGAFTIDSATGAVKFNAIPDFETKSSYSITVKAADASGAFTTKAVTIDVTNVAPNITSGASASVLEGTSTATTVYTAVASDPAGGTVTYSLVAGGDAAAFNIDSSTGAVKFNAIPDFETQSSYSITVKAADASGAFTTKVVTIDVTNVAPNITSGASASVLEGTATTTPVYTAVASDPGGGAITYSLVAGGDAAAFNINSSTGEVKFNAIPDFETQSSYSITVKAADASGLFTTKAVTIDVTNVAPSITSGASASVLEGTSTTIPVYTVVASDPVGGDVTYSFAGGVDDSAFSIDSSTGAVTFNAIPDFETQSSYSITVKASDASGAFATKAVTIDVTNVAPNITSGASASVLEGTSTATTVYTAVASDPAGGTVTYSLVAGGDAAAFNIDSSTGAVKFNAIPDFETQSSYSITVKAADASGAFTTKVVTIDVTNVAPNITSGALASVAEGTPITTPVYTAVASDPGGGAITYSLVAGGDAAAFNIDSTTGAVKFNAIPDFETQSSYSITVKAADASGLFTTKVVTIDVTNVAPSITSGASASVLEGTSTTIPVYTVVASDPIGGDVTYSFAGGVDDSAFSIDSSTGAVTFNAIPDFETQSSYSITVKASDASGAFATKAVTIDVTNVAPNITSGPSASVLEGTSTATTVYTAVASDPAGGIVTYSIVAGGDAAAFNIDSTTGAVKFNAIPDFESKSSYSITVKASDASGAFTTKAVTIDVINVAPNITSGASASVLEGSSTSTVVYTAVASDPVGGEVTYSFGGGIDDGAFTIDSLSGEVKFNAIPDFETQNSYSITVKASDASGAFTTKAVTIDVINVAPNITSGASASVLEGSSTSTVVYTAVASDPGGGDVTYSFGGGIDDGAFTIDSLSGEVKFNAVPDFETQSSYNIIVKAVDASGAFTTKAVTIDVTNVAPSITSGALASVLEGTSTATTVYTVVANDPAGGDVTYSLVAGGDSAAFNIDSVTGEVKFNAIPDFETQSSYSITVKAVDASGAFTTKAVTIDVTNVAPSITSGALASVLEGTSTATTVYTAVANDPAGGDVTYSLVAGGDSAAFTIDSLSGEVKFNAVPDFETQNSYSITVKASDASGAFTTKAITIDVTNVAPSITSGASASVAEGSSTSTVVYTAVASDPAGGDITYSLVTGGDAAAFTIDSSTGAVTFNDIPNFETQSSYNIIVKASDASGAFTTKAITIDVTNVAPIITSGASTSVAEGSSTSTVVYTAVASDPAGGDVTYSFAGGVDDGAFTIDSSTGAVTFNDIPDFETQSNYNIIVKASDASGAFTTKAVTIDVTNVAPSITSGASASILEGSSTSTVVYTAVASDPGGGDVTYSLDAVGDAAAFTIDSVTGEVKFNAVPDFETQSSYNITVKAVDASGAFTTKAVTIDVTNVAPSITSADSTSVAEAIDPSTIVYTVTSADPVGSSGPVTYSFAGGTDDGAFSIDSATGAVRFNNSPDFETKNSYNITVKATDSQGEFTTKVVTINVTNVAPSITSATDVTVSEGINANDLVYSATALDPAGGNVIYTISGADAGAFTIDPTTGVVTINAHPDFETKSVYHFDVKASDPSGAFNVQSVTVHISNLAPIINSATSVNVTEDVPANTTIYTASALDPGGGVVAYELSGADASDFTIDPATGVVTFSNNFVPDFETKQSYSFDVKVSDASGAFNIQTVTVNINKAPSNEPPANEVVIPSEPSAIAPNAEIKNTETIATETAITNAAAENANATSEGIFTTRNIVEASQGNIAVNEGKTISQFTQDLGTIEKTTLIPEASLDTALSYGLNDGVQNLNILNGTLYNVSSTGTYGTLYLNTVTGEYVYIRNDVALHPSVSSVSERFIINVTSAKELKSLMFNVQIADVQNQPYIETSISEHKAGNVDATSNALSITKGMNGQMVIGAVLYKPTDSVRRDIIDDSSEKSQSQINNERFNANINDLLKDFGLK